MVSKKEKESTEQSGKQKKSRVMVILMAVLGAVVAGGIFMGLFVYFVGIPGITPKMKAEKQPVYDRLEIGERVLNLADPGGTRYLRLRMVLEYEKNDKLTEELKEKNAPVMEEILRVLRSKSVEDIRSVEKEDKVKSEIVNGINAKLKVGKIERIYFTDFLIQ